MGPLATFAIILAYGLSIYGWGLWLARTACRDARGFNGLIRPLKPRVSLDILTALGLMLFIAHLAASWRAAAVSSPTPDEAQDTFSEGALLVGILLAGVLFFHCLYLLPSRTINIFDDFFLYLALRPRLCAGVRQYAVSDPDLASDCRSRPADGTQYRRALAQHG